MPRNWTILRYDGTTAVRDLPDAYTPMWWQGFIAVGKPNGGQGPRELHAPGVNTTAIVMVRLTTPPSPGTAYTYTVNLTTPGGPVAFTLADPLGIDQFSMEGKGAISITRALSVNPQGPREPILVARADILASVTVSPLD